MSIKLCFFEVAQLKQVGLKPFLDGIAREPFTKTSSAGFLADRVSANQIEARFIQRIIENHIVEDPSGGSYQFKRISFNEQRFCLRTKRPQLILFNPSAASRSLAGRLNEFADFRIAVDNVKLAPERLMNHLAQSFDELKVYSAVLKELEVSPSTNVKLSFEGSGDVLDQVQRFLQRRRKPAFENLKIHFQFAGGMKRCEIRSNGTLHLYEEYDPSLTKKILQLVDDFVSLGSSSG